jgi:hypothetical protein
MQQQVKVHRLSIGAYHALERLDAAVRSAQGITEATLQSLAELRSLECCPRNPMNNPERCIFLTESDSADIESLPSIAALCAQGGNGQEFVAQIGALFRDIQGGGDRVIALTFPQFYAVEEALSLSCNKHQKEALTSLLAVAECPPQKTASSTKIKERLLTRLSLRQEDLERPLYDSGRYHFEPQTALERWRSLRSSVDERLTGASEVKVTTTPPRGVIVI